MKVNARKTTCLMAALLVLFMAGHGAAEEAKPVEEPAAVGRPMSVPDSYTVKGTPAGLGSAMTVENGTISEENGVPVVHVLKNDLADHYLNYHNEELSITDLEEVYRNGQNPYLLPVMYLTPAADLKIVERQSGPKTFELMREERLIHEDKFTVRIPFYSVKFKKREDGEIVVTQWVPEYVLLYQVLMREPL